MIAMLNLLFGCRHRSITRPMTPVHKPGTPAGETYIVCLECGKRYQYDLVNMRVRTTPIASTAENTRQPSTRSLF
jgi:hypothetical protein